jgi:mycothiol synthase
VNTAPIDVTSATDGISATTREQVLALDAAAEGADGVSGLDDQVRLDLSSHPQSVRHLLARWSSGDELAGYAHADLRAGDTASGHLVVEPAQRRRGVGTALLTKLTEAAGASTLRIWAHGNLDAAKGFAQRHGFAPVRELRKMRRALDSTLAAPEYGPRIKVRTFEPGRDDPAWVSVNASAFRGHPEQGRLSVDDLRQRMDQPWFDPAGFFLAELDGELVGYHWTKVHPPEGQQSQPVGEVYVLGVDPRAQGLGLGKALTLTGLQHLRGAGLNEVILYVDGDNAAAVAVYERLGFTTASVDVMYARP